MSEAKGTVHFEKFDKKSTAMDVVQNCDLRGKSAIITGANRGIGYETAKALASRGCTVIFACRNLQKAEEAISSLKKHFFSAQCDVIHLDLSSLDSVRQFVEEYMSKYDGRPLHYLVLNAAVFPVQHELTKDGYERAYQTQHLSNFFLVRLLSEKLSTSAPSRIVVVSCSAVGMAPEDEIAKQQFDNDFFTGHTNGVEWASEMVYAKSKMLNIMYASQLSKSLASQKISVFIAQPRSPVRTHLYKNDGWKDFVTRISLFNAQTAEQAAATSTLCCVLPGLERFNGGCFTDCHPVDLPSWMMNEELHKKLWTVSENAISKTLTTNNNPTTSGHVSRGKQAAKKSRKSSITDMLALPLERSKRSSSASSIKE